NIKTMVHNLEQGFFIFKKDGLVLPGASQFTLKLFNSDKIEGRSILGLFSTRDYSPQMLERWKEHLFIGKMNFNDVVAMGPKVLKFEDKIVNVEFRPLYKEGTKTLEGVVCNAIDITKKSKIEAKAKFDKDRASMILSLIESPMEFLDLMSDAETEINDIEDSFETNDWYLTGRTFHTLKAGFSRFFCTEVVDLIHSIEDKIKLLQEIKGRKAIGKRPEESSVYSQNLKEFIFLQGKIKSQIKKIVKENRNVVELASKASIGENGGELAAAKKELLNIYETINNRFIMAPVQESLLHYKSIANELAELQDKEIEFSIEESGIMINAPLYKEVFKSVIHIVRNSVDHGVETREERLEKKKEESAKISITFKKKGLLFFQVIIEDDGKGIDPDKVRKIASSQKELEHLVPSKMNDEEIIQIVFEPGFSSREKADHVSGRGIGMDVVKKEVLKLEGNVWAESEVGKGTKFILELPHLK
ncbi:MAG: ATP-binding protein, partial [Bdellovibrionota bacterium]|nr:ATP-binding protein [Bdellovibrionota bacterium]